MNVQDVVFCPTPSCHAGHEGGLPEQSQQRRLPVTSHSSCPCHAARACSLPAADRAGQPLVRGVRAHPVLGSVEKAV